MKKLCILLCLICLTVLGTRALAEAERFSFDAATATVTGYTGSGGDIVIPAEFDGTRVLSLRDGLFSGDASITGLTLSEGIDALDPGVVSSMHVLGALKLPESLRIIGEDNFLNCHALTAVEIPAGVSYIGGGCFCSCEQLISVTFTGPCPSIDDDCFSQLGDGFVCYVPDDRLEEYRAMLPGEIQVTGSGSDAAPVSFATPEQDFSFDPRTGTVTGFIDRSARMDIPAQIGGVAVKAIGEGAFRSAGRLRYLTVPEGVEIVGREAFADSECLRFVALPDSVREIGERAFSGSILGNHFHWPLALEVIGAEAFSGCRITDELKFSPALVSIGERAFRDAWSTELYLAEDCVPSIGSRAFEGSGLTYAKLDAHASPDMAGDAFEGSELEDLELPWDCAPDTRDEWQTWLDDQGLDCSVWIGDPPDCEFTRGDCRYEKGDDGYFYLTRYDGGQEAPYLYPNMWDGQRMVPVRGLGAGVFKGNQALKRFRVTRADCFTAIGDEAFADSTVELIDLYYTVETIGAGAFRNCRNLTELTLPASVTSIGPGAFDGCDRLARVNVLCSADALPEGAFLHCAALMDDPTGIRLAESATDAQVQRLSAEMQAASPLLRAGEAEAPAETPEVETGLSVQEEPAEGSSDSKAVPGVPAEPDVPAEEPEAADAPDPEAERVGTWAVCELTVDNATYPAAFFNLEMNLVLYADGVYTMTGFDGELMTGRWNTTDTGVALDDIALERTVDGGFVGQRDDVQLIFRRQ